MIWKYLCKIFGHIAYVDENGRQLTYYCQRQGCKHLILKGDKVQYIKIK